MSGWHRIRNKASLFPPHSYTSSVCPSELKTLNMSNQIFLAAEVYTERYIQFKRVNSLFYVFLLLLGYWLTPRSSVKPENRTLCIMATTPTFRSLEGDRINRDPRTHPGLVLPGKDHVWILCRPNLQPLHATFSAQGERPLVQKLGLGPHRELILRSLGLEHALGWRCH